MKPLRSGIPKFEIIYVSKDSYYWQMTSAAECGVVLAQFTKSFSYEDAQRHLEEFCRSNNFDTYLLDDKQYYFDEVTKKIRPVV